MSRLQGNSAVHHPRPGRSRHRVPVAYGARCWQVTIVGLVWFLIFEPGQGSLRSYLESLSAAGASERGLFALHP